MPDPVPGTGTGTAPAYAEPSDTELVVRARGGQLAAFEELVRRHTPAAYRLAYRMLGHAGDAEDTVQDAFARAWLALPGFRGDAAFGTWLYRIVTNQALKHRRRSGRETSTDQLADSPDRHDRRPDTQVENELRDEAVRAAIAALPADQRTPLVLREFAGCSYDDIAATMGITTAAVRGRLHRARLELMEAMRPWM